MSQTYGRKTIEDFGRHLLLSGDLDPIYVALNRLELPDEQLKQWLISYWCFYHAGVASYMSEKKPRKFWFWMGAAAANDSPTPLGTKWPRGSERRHFRGQNAVVATSSIHFKYKERPADMVDYIAGDGGAFVDIAKRAQEHKQFGPWISFKIGDMIERCTDTPIDFAEADVFMFDDPVKAALIYWRQKMGLSKDAKPKKQREAVRGVVDHLIKEFKDFSAPPKDDRPVDLQEVETILCKWKSHLNGHYPLNNDIIEINDGLKDWREHSETAKRFLEVMPAPLKDRRHEGRMA